MRKLRMLAWLILPAALLTWWIIWANKALMLTELTASSEKLPEGFDGFRVIHISDLHNTGFGEGNCELLAMIEAQQPDIIVITGDLIDSRRTNVDIALEFAEKTVSVAPVYYVPGNHEPRVMGDYARLAEGLRKAGVTVMEDEVLTLERGGETVRLAGLLDYTFYGKLDKEAGLRNTAGRLSSLLGGEEGYTLLLSHRPQLFSAYAGSKADLVFSGHLHGGQFRLPLIGGLASIGQPDAGLYAKDGTQMVISRGLGNSLFPFRFNNRPEVVAVTLEKNT